MAIKKLYNLSFIRKFNDLDELKERKTELIASGYTICDLEHTYYIRTPSDVELSRGELTRFLDMKLEFGNIDHIENIKALELATIEEYLRYSKFQENIPENLNEPEKFKFP